MPLHKRGEGIFGILRGESPKQSSIVIDVVRSHLPIDVRHSGLGTGKFVRHPAISDTSGLPYLCNGLRILLFIVKKIGLGFLIIFVLMSRLWALELWVSPDGNDGDVGTKEKPLADVSLALRKARELRRLGKVSANEPVRIILRGGVYALSSPLLVRPEDSGTETSPTSIK